MSHTLRDIPPEDNRASHRDHPRLLDGNDQSKLKPLEVAFNLGETGAPQPSHLFGKVSETVGWVVLHPADLPAEAFV